MLYSGPEGEVIIGGMRPYRVAMLGVVLTQDKQGIGAMQSAWQAAVEPFYETQRDLYARRLQTDDERDLDYFEEQMRDAANNAAKKDLKHTDIVVDAAATTAILQGLVVVSELSLPEAIAKHQFMCRHVANQMLAEFSRPQ